MNTSISHDFFQYGIDGIGVNRVAEVRATEQERARSFAALRAPERPSSIRRWLGSALISVGNGIAGRNLTGGRLDAMTAPPTMGSDPAR
jgi:hypothetical protein